MVPAAVAEKSWQRNFQYNWRTKKQLRIRSKDKEEFIKVVTDGIAAPPQYFPINAQINKEGYESLDEVLEQGMKGLPVKEFKSLINDDIIVLDTRTETEFVRDLFRFH
jgi:hypothetical protein